ncbi:NAD(P)H-dependent FMN reductase [Bradyrhizobium diazoefficiens]
MSDDLSFDSNSVGSQSLLGISTSLKPGPGKTQTSASRWLLEQAIQQLKAIYPETCLLDLRTRPLPMFDGRMPCDHPDVNLQTVLRAINAAGALLIAVPAYWSGVSASFKNLIEVVCGPAYDSDDPSSTVFRNKLVGLLIIGADSPSTRHGSEQAKLILSAAGALLVDPLVEIANPRQHPEQLQLALADTLALAKNLLIKMHL